MIWPDGFGGISVQGVFKSLPAWINKDLSPGTTDQTNELGWSTTKSSILRLQYFFFSPNLVWFCMALSIHMFVPYPIEEAKEKGFASDWMLARFALNYSVAFLYYGFFFVSLYWAGWANRKYNPGIYPTAGNMAHNLWYWSLAIVQWTWWECVMVRLWATGLVPFTTNAEILSDPYQLAVNVLWVLAIPLWRDLHFYIAHRFIHVRAVYRYVHSLHHRNADPEPFSGMTMHPVEHLYYFSNAFAPSLYMNLSPLIFLWNFIHLTIAPGAGHSGWEDHFQADQYHYVHHAKFECNYGSPFSAFIDQYFGTFREKLGSSKQYTGAASDAELEKETEKESGKKGAKVWSRQAYLGLPATWDHAVYTVWWVLLFPLAYWGAIANKTGLNGQRIIESVTVGSITIPTAKLVGAVIAYSPVVMALVLAYLSDDRMSWRWPFQKEPVFGAFGLFLVLGWAACIKPVYDATTMIC
jgi:sterol desaturase/sphingolipid hydroxylase (fatty acid hydroxylase superfamily)